MNKNSRGFTIIELVIIIVIIGAASVLFFAQKQNVEIAARDNQRKVAINSIYYGLEKVFYKANGYYPSTIGTSNLPSVDPELFKDPNGIAVGTTGSDYRYEPTNCNDNKCKSYTLRADLQNEADFIKTNNSQ